MGQIAPLKENLKKHTYEYKSKYILSKAVGHS